MTTLKVKLTMIEGLLGTQPGESELLAEHIAKRTGHTPSQDELDALDVGEEVEKGTTVFPRDEEGQPFVYDYQIKGFFKDACGALRRVKDTRSIGLKAFKKEIDGLIFPQPRRIPIQLPEGGALGICERPLRAQTPQGERVAISRSEEAPAGTVLAFEVKILKDDLADDVQEWLEYGALRGLGQWRNSGKGRFTAEVEVVK